MDAEQIRKRKAAREEVLCWLNESWNDISERHNLAVVDKRLLFYVKDIIGNSDYHNLFELLAVRRFLQMLDRYEFRPEAVRKVITCLESLPFPTKSGFKPITLSPVQVFFVTGIYGYYRADGRRLVNNAMLFCPRKFGKTTIVAGLAIYELLFGDADGQIYTCANSYNQAHIAFENLRKCLKALDKNGNRFKVNREAIYNNIKGRSSFARCLASDPATLDGLNASLYILDEFSQAKSADLRNVMATSTGTRENPLELIITTASDLLDSPCVDTLNANKATLMGEQKDDSMFALIFEPDVEDKEDSPITWKKVQPHLGVTIKEDYYAQQYDKAMLTSDNMLAFRTKLLNVFAVNESKSWITGDEIRNLYQPFSFESCQSRPYCMVAFDLSVWDDFSAVCYEIYDAVNKKFHFHIEYYLPSETLVKHPNRDMYKRWVEKGYLKIIEGNVIDYDVIARDIVSRNGAVRICGIGYDPYKAQQAVNTLTAMGAQQVLHPIKQTYGEFTAPMESLEMLIKTGKASFTPNDITPYCFQNAIADEDRNGNRKIIKSALSNKIDGAITCLMSQDLFNKFKR